MDSRIGWATPVPLTTRELAASHLSVSERHMRALWSQTPLLTIGRIFLGQGRGSYYPVPVLGIALLRQLATATPYHIDRWTAALNDLLQSSSWRNACEAMTQSSTIWPSSSRGRFGFEELVQTEALRPLMHSLYGEMVRGIVDRGVGELWDAQGMIVDRLETDEDAVVLVGEGLAARMLPRALLRLAGLDYEKARGVLTATQTTMGVAFDVFAALDAPSPSTWRPDPDLVAMVVDAAKPPTVTFSYEDNT